MTPLGTSGVGATSGLREPPPQPTASATMASQATCCVNFISFKIDQRGRPINLPLFFVK